MYDRDKGCYPPDDSDCSSRPLVKYLHPDKPEPSRGRYIYFNFDPTRIKNGEYLSLLGKPFYYRENAFKEPKTPDMHNPDTFDLWTEDSKGDKYGINNWKGIE